MKAYIIFKDYQHQEEGMDLLKQVAGEITIRETYDRPSEEELKQLVSKYDIMVIGMKEQMTDAVFEKATRLKYLCTSSIGTDHISKKFFDSNKITVINVSDANIISVAEFALTYILADIKFFKQGHKAFAEGSDRLGMPSLPRELSSMTIGVIGAGKIASKFIELAKPFQPNMLCWTFHPEVHSDLEKMGTRFTDLKTLFEESDYIVSLIPLSDKTDRLISKELLAIAKPNAKIINASRMDIMDNAAFKDFVLEGKFHDSLLDCLNSEIDADIAKDLLPYIQFTPHVAGVSEEAQVRIFTEIMEKLKKAARSTF